MERAMTADEKIRRAEEIYQRRRMNETRQTTARVNVADTPKDYRLFKKMVIQIMACLCIYFVFFLIKNGNYIFSEDFIKRAQEILSYDLNFGEQYKNIANFFENKSETEEQGNEIIPPAEEVEQPETEVETLSAVSREAVAEELLEESSSISQTLTDAGDILANYSLVKPLTGTITSRFGLRTPTTETVPKYHTGIDIAANTGTKFVAAMEGKVILVSDQGDYRKPYKNTKR